MRLACGVAEFPQALGVFHRWLKSKIARGVRDGWRSDWRGEARSGQISSGARSCLSLARDRNRFPIMRKFAYTSSADPS